MNDNDDGLMLRMNDEISKVDPGVSKRKMEAEDGNDVMARRHFNP